MNRIFGSETLMGGEARGLYAKASNGKGRSVRLADRVGPLALLAAPANRRERVGLDGKELCSAGLRRRSGQESPESPGL